MNDKTLFERFDEELNAQLGSRRDALRGMGKLGAGLALASVPSIFASLLRPEALTAQAATPSVPDVLRFALTLEYLEWQFYEQGLAVAGLIPAADRPIFRTFRDHEHAHVRFLEDVLGLARNARLPDFDFSAGGRFPWNTDYAVYRALAQGFEDTGVRAYKGQAPNLMSDKMALTAALQIHSVEGRHAAMIRRRNGDFQEMGAQKGWIRGRLTGVVPAEVGGIPVGNAIYGPGVPAASFPAEDNVVHAGVDLRTLTYDPPLAGANADERALQMTQAYDEPLDMQTVTTIAGLFIRG
jgi:hypothetical protein